MQHKSTGPFFFQVCICLCYGVTAHSTVVKAMSVLPIGSPVFRIQLIP